MGLTLLQKILSAHLVSGKPIPGEDIGLKISQAFAHDATGPLAFLQFEAIGVSGIRIERAAMYVDRTILQTRPEDADDQQYLARAAAEYGAAFSAAGNGAAVQVHLERFAEPGKTALAADAYTPVCGAAGMLAIGASGLEVAAAMAGAPFYMPMPRCVAVRLGGRLQAWATPKDVGLEVLRRLGNRGGIGRVLEFGGPALADLSVADRATIAAMAAETGCVSILFPSDDQTRRFLEAQGRARQFVDLLADPTCAYDETIDVDLSALEPLVVPPGSPAEILPVQEMARTRLSVGQVVIGSFAEPSFAALRAVAAMTAGRALAPGVSAVVQPASRQVLQALARSGDLEKLIAAGWRVLEPGCGPELGIGQVPPEGEALVRTFTRNTPGRSGRDGDAVYLAGPLVAAACAVTGHLTDPRTLGLEAPPWDSPERVAPGDRLLSGVTGGPVDATPHRGHDSGPDSGGSARDALCRPPHLKVPPVREAPGIRVEAPVMLKVGDRMGADEILPADPDTMALRTDAAALADRLFPGRDPAFAGRCRASGGGFLVAGTDFAHGPGREAMAMALSAAGLTAVLARDFARVNRSNLIHFGILPLILVDPADLDRLEVGDTLELPDVRAVVRSDEPFAVRNLAKGADIQVRHGLTPRQKDILLAGGLLAWARRHSLSPTIV